MVLTRRRPLAQRGRVLTSEPSERARGMRLGPVRGRRRFRDSAVGQRGPRTRQVHQCLDEARVQDRRRRSSAPNRLGRQDLAAKRRGTLELRWHRPQRSLIRELDPVVHVPRRVRSLVRARRRPEHRVIVEVRSAVTLRASDTRRVRSAVVPVPRGRRRPQSRRIRQRRPLVSAALRRVRRSPGGARVLRRRGRPARRLGHARAELRRRSLEDASTPHRARDGQGRRASARVHRDVEESPARSPGTRAAIAFEQRRGEPAARGSVRLRRRAACRQTRRAGKGSQQRRDPPRRATLGRRRLRDRPRQARDPAARLPSGPRGRTRRRLPARRSRQCDTTRPVRGRCRRFRRRG